MLALAFGLIIPTALGWTWDDPIGAFVWGGLVTRLASKYPPSESDRFNDTHSLALHLFGELVRLPCLNAIPFV